METQPLMIETCSVFGEWTPDTFGQLKIEPGVLNASAERTLSSPSNLGTGKRYWKAPITFKFSTFSSTALRFDGVLIPRMTGNARYGTDFVYVALPGFIAKFLKTACERLRQTDVNERSVEIRVYLCLDGVGLVII
jgi:hypothetical protein